MDAQLEKELTEFFSKGLNDYFQTLTLDELKCIDWLVMDADPFIEKMKQKKER